MNDFRDEFPDTFFDLIEETGLSVKEYAAKIKINRNVVDRALRGDTFPDRKTLIKIADYHGISLDYLLSLTAVNAYVPKACDLSFYERIRVLFSEESDYRIARLAGVKTSCVSKWKRSGHLPSIDTLVRLSQNTGYSLDKLVGR